MDVDEDSDCDADWVSGSSIKRRKRKNVPQRSLMPMTQREIFSYLAEEAAKTTEVATKRARSANLAARVTELERRLKELERDVYGDAGGAGGVGSKK